MAALIAIPEWPRQVRRALPRFLSHTLPVLTGLAGGGSLLLGCSGDTGNPVSPDASQLYWALQLNQHAITLALTAPYDTVQLSATAHSATGTLVAGVDSVVHYSVSDSSVLVSTAGLVTAHSVTGGVQVIATLTVRGVTLADTAQIQVTETAPPAPLTTFSIQLPAGDSAKCALDRSTCEALPVTATDVHGTPLSPMAYFTSSDPLVGTLNIEYGQAPVIVTGVEVGHVTFYATTLFYGVARQDSLRYTIGYPIMPGFNIQSREQIGSKEPQLFFSPSTFTVGVGAIVQWSNPYLLPIDLVFDDSDAVAGATLSNIGPNNITVTYPGGNIAPFEGSYEQEVDPNTEKLDTVFNYGNAARSFPVAGTYHYHSRLFGTTGTLIVSAGP